MTLYLTTTSMFNNLNYKPSTDQWLLNKEEIQLKDIALLPDSLKTGWGLLAPGTAPDWVWDNVTGRPEAPPTPEHKRAFSIEVIDEQNGLMTWSGTGHGSCKAIETIFEEISKAKNQYPKKIPICRYHRSEAKKVGKGNTRIPIFSITGWSHPDDLPWATNNVDDFGGGSGSLSVTGSTSVEDNIPF